MGDYLGSVIDAFADNKPVPAPPAVDVDLGVPYLPQIKKDTSDRYIFML